MPDKLISAESLKKEVRNYIESDGMLSLINHVIDTVPSIDPTCHGQWMRYDMIAQLLRSQARGLRIEDPPKKEGAAALDEMAEYFGHISSRIKEAQNE